MMGEKNWGRKGSCSLFCITAVETASSTHGGRPGKVLSGVVGVHAR
ncbi:Uncharacterised protein [Klebsiella quasipneumoniae]|nr:Uncharacterised protein [Klebsiella quasipneumoniae]